MASYSDEHYVDFWKPLIRTSGPPPYLPPYRREVDEFDSEEEAVLDAFGVAEPMLLKAHRQITLLHPELDASADGIPMPYAGVVKDWSTPPFCGGWHSWNPRVSASDVVSRLIQPFKDDDPNLNLFTCGEAFSLEQGWIEGALKSAELVLNKIGVPAPNITRDIYEQVRCAGYEEYIES